MPLCDPVPPPSAQRRFPMHGAECPHARLRVHAPEVRNERLCRFEFPERPGALTEFLDKLGGRWNISLFHYRNHGSDFGRVLAGFEVEDADLPAFRAFLDELGYPNTPEYDNTAYRFFLG